ncbi:hypothetical protein BV898_13607 [Hypsibius exemplaris]|uniref:Uncharacterized protein n=1 Tax=Hypsibius exemplaris TaxID=2072580 RepID=A0A1W0WAB9_HYPEX|nr:hypothetical protein BV898_13607 [Hypsibius exemplaris]
MNFNVVALLLFLGFLISTDAFTLANPLDGEGEILYRIRRAPIQPPRSRNHKDQGPSWKMAGPFLSTFARRLVFGVPVF